MNTRLAGRSPAGPGSGPEMPAGTEAVRRSPPRLAVHAAMALRGAVLGLADRMMPAHAALMEHAHQFAKAHLLSSVAELRIADHLASGPKDASELGRLTACDPGALHRALRAAAVFGVVRLDRRGRFHTTRLLKQLRAADTSRAADWCRYIGSGAQQAAWTALSQSIRTGDSAFRTVHGCSSFEWFTAHPEEGRQFNSGIAGLTNAEAPLIAGAYPFPDAGVVCDIGGGTGALLAEVLRRHPRSRGILVESPSVLAQAARFLRAAGIADRIELAEGDLFRHVRATADIYLLKWVLHDWDDTTCQTILRTIGTAMPNGAKLVVIEGVQDYNSPHPRFSMVDLQMLVATDGGRERSVTQLLHLISAAGFHPGRARRTATDLVLLEAIKP
jgi:O-methyltransferase domain